ncbi:MAG: DUF2314 domain-containing protein [Usitatibacter sp.]
MKKLIVVMALIAAPAFAQHADGVLEKPRRVQRNDPAMEAAYARAKESLDGFFELVASKPPHIKTPSVKVRVREGQNVEDFWVTPFSAEAGGFGGFLQNEPATIKKHKLGDPIRFTKADVVDWMYVDQTRKKIVGNYTGCALLARGPASEREKARLQYGLDCTN